MGGRGYFTQQGDIFFWAREFFYFPGAHFFPHRPAAFFKIPGPSFFKTRFHLATVRLFFLAIDLVFKTRCPSFSLHFPRNSGPPGPPFTTKLPSPVSNFPEFAPRIVFYPPDDKLSLPDIKTQIYPVSGPYTAF